MVYGYVYKIIIRITGQIYIGQTTQSLKTRFDQLNVKRTCISNNLVGRSKSFSKLNYSARYA